MVISGAPISGLPISGSGSGKSSNVAGIVQALFTAQGNSAATSVQSGAIAALFSVSGVGVILPPSNPVSPSLDTTLTNKPAKHFSKRDFQAELEAAARHAKRAGWVLEDMSLEELWEALLEYTNSRTRNYALERLIDNRIKERDALRLRVDEAKARIRDRIQKLKGH